jgi:hypothetical protein
LDKSGNDASDTFAVSTELCEIFLDAEEHNLDAIYETSTMCSSGQEDKDEE